MTFPCPCCGKPMEGRPDPREVLASIRLTRLERRICGALANRFGSYVLNDAVIEAMYFDDADGGPVSASNVLGVCLTHLHKKLKGSGLVIESGRGWNSGRRLTWADAP